MNLADLSTVQQQLLQRLLEFRFATTQQLARSVRGGFANDRSALRQVSRHLAALEAKRCVTHLERRIGGWQGGSVVAIWALTTTGRRLLTGQPTRTRPRLASTTFLDHCLAVAEARVVIGETCVEYEGMSASIQHEPASWRRTLGAQGQPVTLKPDLAVTVTSAEYVDRYFMEIDRATENPARVVRTCWHYQRHRAGGTEQAEHGSYPAVVWIVPSTQRLLQLKRYLAQEPGLNEHLFRVITMNELPALIRDGPGG